MLMANENELSIYLIVGGLLKLFTGIPILILFFFFWCVYFLYWIFVKKYVILWLSLKFLESECVIGAWNVVLKSYIF